MPKRIDEAAVFNAAVNVLTSRGYSATTTQEIAQLAGVNEATLFRRFGNKAGLIARTIDHQLADTPFGRLAFTGDLRADLEAIIQAYIDTNTEHGDIVLIILQEAPRFPELKAAVSTPLRNIQRAAAIVARYQEQGQLQQESTWHTIAALVGPIVVNQLMRRADLGVPVTAIEPAAHVERFLTGRQVPSADDREATV